MSEDVKTGGRPKGSTTGVTQLRTLRMGPLWDQGKAAAEEYGYASMTALVEEALREKLAKLNRARSR